MNITVKAKTPTIPNFIMIDTDYSSDAKIKVGDLSDDELNLIAEEWRKKLLEHAKYQREQAAKL